MLQHGQFSFSAGPLDRVGLGVGIVAGFAILAVIIAAQSRGVPAIPFLVIGVGIAVGLAAGHRPVFNGFGPALPSLVVPSGSTFVSAFWLLVVPQLALSIGNSLLATVSAARAYFGAAAERVRSGRLALTMGIADLVVSRATR